MFAKNQSVVFELVHKMSRSILAVTKTASNMNPALWFDKPAVGKLSMMEINI